MVFMYRHYVNQTKYLHYSHLSPPWLERRWIIEPISCKVFPQQWAWRIARFRSGIILVYWAKWRGLYLKATVRAEDKRVRDVISTRGCAFVHFICTTFALLRGNPTDCTICRFIRTNKPSIWYDMWKMCLRVEDKRARDVILTKGRVLVHFVCSISAFFSKREILPTAPYAE